MFRARFDALDIGGMAKDEDGGHDGVDDRELKSEAEEVTAHQSEVPHEDGSVPPMEDEGESEDPSDQSADDRGDDGGEGDEFLQVQDDDIGENAADDELNPRGQDVKTHEASDALAAFEADVDRPAVPDGRGKARAPIHEGGRVIAIPNHVIMKRGEAEDGPSREDGDQGFDHVEDDDEDADLLAEDSPGVRAAGIMGIIIAGILLEEYFADEDAIWDGADEIAC